MTFSVQVLLDRPSGDCRKARSNSLELWHADREYGRVRAQSMRYFVQIEGKEHVADVTELPGGGFDVRLCDADGKPVKRVDVDVSTGANSLAIRVDGRMFDLVLDGDAPKPSVFASGRRPAVT